MNLDAQLKRGYPLVIGGVLAIIAYLQGAGIASLIAEQLPTRGATPPPSPAARAPLQTKKTAAPILARNAFDSETGPINPNKAKEAPPPPPVEDLPEPGELPQCSGTEVVLIAGSEDPQFSFALLKAGGSAKMHRVGDAVSGQKVSAIEWDHVVLEGAGPACAAWMHVKGPAAFGSNPTAPPPRSGARPSSRSPIPPVAGTDEITKVSDTEFRIEKNGDEKVKQIKQAFMKSARVVEGQGLRLQRSAQTTILGQIGLEKGDLVKTVNGHDMTNPDRAAEAYGTMSSSKRIQVVVERAGKTMTIDVGMK